MPDGQAFDGILPSAITPAMRIAAALTALLLSRGAEAFAPPAPAQTGSGYRSSSALFDMPAPAAIVKENTVPDLKPSPGGAPVAVRYSDFLKLVDANRVEKVTFSADGTRLLGVDTDGTRIAIEALPNDPDLLTSLTNHKVRIVLCELTESVQILRGKVREEICVN
jgi:cell division protease FtsH